MKKFLLSAVILFNLSGSALAADYPWYAGGGIGTAVPILNNTFNQAANTDLMASAWLRNESWYPVGVEFGYDYLDFSRVSTKANFLGVGAVFRLLEQSPFRPSLLVGGGWGKADGASRLSGKLRLGVEHSFRETFNFGFYLNYHFLPAKNLAPAIHAVGPMLGFSLAFGGEAEEVAPPAVAPSHVYEAPAPAPAPVVEIQAVVLDSDGDGVADGEDHCPNTVAGTSVTAFGCPLNEKVEIRLEVNFGANSDQLSAGSEAEVERAAMLLRSHPKINATVEGHSDTSGNAAKNRKLSLARAEAVKAALVKAGVDAGRLKAAGFGSDKPLVSNETFEGREKNRRVLLSIDR